MVGDRKRGVERVKKKAEKEEEMEGGRRKERMGQWRRSKERKWVGGVEGEVENRRN